jgi:PAS domain S-box-containing protein
MPVASALTSRHHYVSGCTPTSRQELHGPCDNERGTKELPSLILRLEQLSRSEAPAQPATEPEPATAREPVTEREPGTAPANGHPPQHATAAPEPAGAAAERGAPDGDGTPRIVDLATSERLSSSTPLSRWSAAVAAAHDACFVVDGSGVVLSISVAAVELLGCADTAVIGRHILDVINLVDLETGAAHPEYAVRITPLAVLDGPGLGRSLMRVRHSNGTLVTLDTASVPIHDVSAHLLGSVSFLAPIPSR